MRSVLALLGVVGLAASCGRASEPGAQSRSGSPATSGQGGSSGQAGASDQPSGGASDAAGAPSSGGSSGQGESAGSGGKRVGSGGTSAAGRDGVPAGQTGAGDNAGGAAGDTGGSTASGGFAGTLPMPTGSCGFAIDASLSPTIGTVGIVEWAVNMASVESASIEFGLDESYGLTAPVDLTEPSNRTLLLGMKASRDYHFHVVAHGGGEDCQSPDQVLTTGPLPNGLPSVTVTDDQPAARAGGYLVSSFVNAGPAFILDADGDYVWWSGNSEMGRARMSYDGKFMWYCSINVHGGAGDMRRVGMDGANEEIHSEFGDIHHDFTLLPDGTIGFIEHNARADRIMERAPDGTVTKVVDVPDAHGGTTTNHVNSIHYHADDDSYTFSDLNQNAYVKIKRSGETVWILGGTTNQFIGDGASWTREHGHHLIAPDRLLFYNNGKIGSTSLAVEVSLDFSAMTATRVFTYDGGFASAIYGDVQRLDNGNTLVTYSTSGVIREVDASGAAVQTLTFPVGGATGYAMKRASLYGPPSEPY
jgi:hypothetical protein